MIPVNKYSSRLGERVRLVVLHTSEGARDVASLAAYLNRPGVQASYHGAVDDQRYEAYVNYSNAAWHLRNGNQESDGLCLCAFVRWSRDEWLRHSRMLELAAAWIAERCLARRVPIRLLSAAEVGDAIRNDAHPGGVCDHYRYTVGTGDGTHTDVGRNFPFDVVMARAQQLAGKGPGPAFTEEDQDVQNYPISGTGRMVLICPTGDAAANNRHAWLSAAVLDGTGSIRVFAQGARQGIHDWWWNEQELATTADNLLRRPWMQLRSGVTHLVISWDLTKAKGGGVLCLETRPQA
ncbi:MAG: peptidoglycan recognition protein family protein [Pseudonocardiaceae bacterium]